MPEEMMTGEEDLMVEDDLGDEGADLAVSQASHTVEEIPELTQFGVGDTVSFIVAGISEDGKTYNLEFTDTAMTEAPPEMGIGMDEGMGGRDAIMQEML